MKVTIEIELENDAMQTYAHVGAALKQLAKDQFADWRRVKPPADGGRIRDLNGNTVGTWRIEEPVKPVEDWGCTCGYANPVSEKRCQQCGRGQIR